MIIWYFPIHPKEYEFLLRAISLSFHWQFDIGFSQFKTNSNRGQTLRPGCYGTKISVKALSMNTGENLTNDHIHDKRNDDLE